MANNYCQFSFAIALRNEAEVEWAKNAVALLELYVEYEAAVDADGLWIHADESGTPEHVVDLAQAYLRRFDPEGKIAFTWADWCSKPRLDEFGGGAVVITATDAEFMNTYSWVHQKLTEGAE